MRNKRPSGRRKKRLLKRILMLLVLAAVGAGAWSYLSPLLMESSVTTYASYTVGRGDIATTKSFSATLSVGESETLYNDSGAESIRTVYVTGGQEVQEGDTLMELSDGTILTAGIDGVVNEIRYAAGDWLRPNAQLVQVCDLTHLQVSLQVDEYDVEKVAAGQACTITIVPLGMDFETELKHVSRLSSATGRVAYYTATAELTVPENVLPGMTASVTMASDSVEDVLVLDMAALSFDEAGEPYVLRKNGEAYEQIPVETGLTDGMQVEIISGLSEGEEVWAVSGEEAVQAEFSLAEIYKRIFGETVIINEERGSGGGSRGGSFDMSQMPKSNMDFSGMATPSDMAWPEGMELPEGMAFPESMEAPQSGGFPFGESSEESSQQDMSDGAAAAQENQGIAPPEGMTMPEGGFPEGMATPSDMARPGGQEQGGRGQRPDGAERTGGSGEGGQRQKPDAAEDNNQQGSDGQ